MGEEYTEDDLPEELSLRLNTAKAEERREILVQVMNRIQPRFPQTSLTESIFNALRLALQEEEEIHEWEQDRPEDMEVGRDARN